MLTNLEGLKSNLFINDKHLADLRSSGINDDTARRARVFSGSAKEVRQLLNFPAGGGLVFLYGRGGVRVKPDVMPKSGKVYYAPKDSGGRMYIPANLDESVLEDSAAPILVTEGEKKAVKACQEGFNCIAFSGVWNWLQKGQPIDDLNLVKWAGRSVTIAFDSDVTKNRNVLRAEQRLSEELTSRGAIVDKIRLPRKGKEKVGLDDFLVENGPQSLANLLKENVKIRQRAIEVTRILSTVSSLLDSDTHFPQSLSGFPVPSPLPYKKGSGGEEISDRSERNTLSMATWLWAQWGQTGGLAFDTLIQSPLDPNKKRPGTKFVEWRGEIRVQVEGSTRLWPLAVAWYNSLRRSTWKGGRFKIRRIDMAQLAVWDLILQTRSGGSGVPVIERHHLAQYLF